MNTLKHRIYINVYERKTAKETESLGADQDIPEHLEFHISGIRL